MAALVRRMADAGASPELIAIAIEEIEAVQVSLDARRAVDRDRKRIQRQRLKSTDVTGQSEDSHGTVTGQSLGQSGTPSLDKEIPQTPEETKPSPTPPYNPPAPRCRGTRLPDDFEPPEDWIAWAMKKRGWSRSEATDECECFARFWQSKPGREAMKLDWPKTWQNWAVNSRRQLGSGYDREKIRV